VLTHRQRLELDLGSRTDRKASSAWPHRTGSARPERDTALLVYGNVPEAWDQPAAVVPRPRACARVSAPPLPSRLIGEAHDRN
jgi:hypothetical protein